MTIQELSGKTVCILGFGKEGKAMLSALEAFAPDAEVTVADKNTAIDGVPERCWKQVGEGWLENLQKFDVLIKSPGIPPSLLPASIGDKLTTPTQIFFDSIPGDALTIGVTGTKGKSTTTSLIATILKAAGKEVLMLGNIGEPMIGHLADVTPDTIVVMELSSYQLMDLRTSPVIAVVTSFFPEHLDYHGSEEAYREAKGHITKFQPEDAMAFYATGSADVEWIASRGRGKKVAVSAEDSPVHVTATQLLGYHNQHNIALAWKVAEFLRVKEEIAVEAIRSFHGLPHRLESLGVHHGIEWVDDAISTTPESAVAALNALGDRVQTMLLGGQDRGVDFAPLIARLATSAVKNAVLFPGSGERIAAGIQEANLPIALFPVASMEEAVKLAILHTPGGDPAPIVLLSPASPSYGMFKNFEEKGDQFKKYIIGDTVR